VLKVKNANHSAFCESQKHLSQYLGRLLSIRTASHLKMHS
jgi:hypothetical protein